MGLQLVEGRTFSGDHDGGDRDSFLVNETAVKKLGWTTAVGRRLEQVGDTTGVIVGVIKDFHFASLHEPIEPIVLRLGQNEYRYLSARVRSDRIPETLAFLRSVWKKVLPGRPFEASFLDQDFDRLYRGEMRLGKILMVFAGLAMFVACLGLFGLAAFAAERRTKEIGIRKVLGASSTSLVALLNREFVRCVIVANLVAWPVAAYVMNRWLKNFAYRASLAPPIFLGAAALTLVIALLTVSGQALRAARSNPADTLRYE